MTTRKPLFERGPLTDWLVAQMKAKLPDGVLFGDHVAPDAGGWSTGQPGVGTFAAYVTLGTAPGAPFGAQQLTGMENDGWQLRYTLRAAGGLRNQADWTADKGRQTWHHLGEDRPEIDLGGDGVVSHWRPSSFVVLSMGAVVRNDSINPPFWEIADEVALTLNRSRT